jgi:hypothetical protein
MQTEDKTRNIEGLGGGKVGSLAQEGKDTQCEYFSHI